MVPQILVSKEGTTSWSFPSDNSLTWLMASVNIGDIAQQRCLEGDTVRLTTSFMNTDDNYQMPFYLWDRGMNHNGCPEYDWDKDKTTPV